MTRTRMGIEPTSHAHCAYAPSKPTAQLARKLLLARRLEAATMTSKSAAAALTTCAGVIQVEKTPAMPIEAAGR